MGAIYLCEWYSRYAPSHLYEGIICGIEKSIISISIGIWREAQGEARRTVNGGSDRREEREEGGGGAGRGRIRVPVHTSEWGID